MTTPTPPTHSPNALDRFFTVEQRARALAAHEARAVLQSRSSLTTAGAPPSMVDVVTLVQWIIDGDDPWDDDEAPDDKDSNQVASDEAAKVPVLPTGYKGRHAK